MSAENGNMLVRGKALASIPKFISKNFGKDGYQKWLDTISAEAHAVYAISIQQDEWYPLRESLIQPCANIAQLFYEWDLKKAAWESGRYSADFSLKNVYKLIVKKNSINDFLDKACEYMHSYYKPAGVEVNEVNDNRAVFHITDFPEIDKTVEYRIAGWIQRAIEINGGKQVIIKIPKSLAEFKEFTEYLVSWE